MSYRSGGKRSKRVDSLKVEIGSAAQSHAQPTTSSHGVDISSWAENGLAPEAAIVYLASASTTIAISAGAEIQGYDSDLEEWVSIGQLNDGSAITLTTNNGYAERVIDVGVFDRLAVVDTGDGGTHVYGFKPVITIG